MILGNLFQTLLLADMFYKTGEVIFGKFYHLKVIGLQVSVVLFWKNQQKMDYLGIIWGYCF